MRAPARIEVQRCIGCGAMHRWGTCEASCTEVEAQLVDAADLDAVVALAARTRDRVAALTAVARDVVAAADPLARRSAAAAALHVAGPGALPDPPEPTTVWWCEECGAFDAPQPCIGVCIRRPAAFVTADAYAAARGAAEAAIARERRLERAVRMVALVRPRPGEEQRTAQALQDQAREALGP
jgi:hypothetical protein